jgi:hypothetical protein
MPALAQASSARLLVVDGALVTQIELARGRIQQLLQRRLADASPASLRAWHASLPAVDHSVAIGHGLDAPWAALPGDSLAVIGTLHGTAPAGLWLQPTAAPAAVAA